LLKVRPAHPHKKSVYPSLCGDLRVSRFEELSSLWSEEALTAVVLPRWHIDQSIKRSLGQKLGSLKAA